MEQRIFAFSLIIEGTTEKVLQFSATLVNLQQKLWFRWTQNVLFEHNREIQARKTPLIDIIFAMKKKSVDLFRAAPYMLMLVVHKDALFHYPLFFLPLQLLFSYFDAELKTVKFDISGGCQY